MAYESDELDVPEYPMEDDMEETKSDSLKSRKEFKEPPLKKNQEDDEEDTTDLTPKEAMKELWDSLDQEDKSALMEVIEDVMGTDVDGDNEEGEDESNEPPSVSDKDDGMGY